MDQKFWYQKFQHTLEQPYKAIMFDIDGTVMVRGTHELFSTLVPFLVNISEKIPVAFCSGRRLKLPVEFVAYVAKKSKKPAKVLQNWFLACENGAVSYYYDARRKEYKEWHREPWPAKISKDKVRTMITEKLWRYRTICSEQPSIFTFHMERNRNGAPIFNPHALAQRTRKFATTVKKELHKIPGHTEVAILDSQVGVMITPKKGNKDRGVIEFARYLRAERGMDISHAAREIAVVGDQPGPGLNDEAFLNGVYGTALTVGGMTKKAWPIPVFDRAEKRVCGPEGTRVLLEQMKFRTI